MATAAIDHSPHDAADLADARRRAAEVERRVIRSAFRPPPRMTVTEWADAFRYLSAESSAEPGKYTSDRAPYQREPMDAMSDPRIRRVVLMWPSQVGKTEIANNFIAQRIDMKPGPLLVVQPTLQMADAWSKDRLAPMIRDTPRLRGKVRDSKARDSDNTILHKKFDGGQLTIVGSNSPAGLAARPIRDVVVDEADRCAESAGAEGDAIGLAFRRQATFADKKQLIISSPTIKGQSRIEKEYEQSDRRKWVVPCPHCEHEQILRWGGERESFGIKWDRGNPDTAHYVCESCAAVIEEMWKGWMNARGRWVAENEGHPTRGYWMNALASPWAKWADLVREFLEVKRDAIRLRQFVNTVLCETWEDEGAQLDAHVLMDRLEDYGEHIDCPLDVAMLTCAIDVQGDRLEGAVWGWGVDEEAWLIHHEMFPGDPGTPAPWQDADEYIGRTWRHAAGVELRPAVTFVDSGGHHTKEAYAFTRARVARKVFAIKGSSLEGAPLLGRPSRGNSAKAILYSVGVFTGKESIMSRFAKIKEPGPGYIHLPAWLDGEQLHQFTNEKLVTRIVGGRAKRVWIQTGRNEQLDLACYNLAALQQIGPYKLKTLKAEADRLRELAAKRAAAAESGAEPADEEPTSTPRRTPRRSWRDRW